MKLPLGVGTGADAGALRDVSPSDEQPGCPTGWYPGGGPGSAGSMMKMIAPGIPLGGGRSRGTRRRPGRARCVASRGCRAEILDDVVTRAGAIGFSSVPRRDQPTRRRDDAIENSTNARRMAVPPGAAAARAQSAERTAHFRLGSTSVSHAVAEEDRSQRHGPRRPAPPPPPTSPAAAALPAAGRLG